MQVATRSVSERTSVRMVTEEPARFALFSLVVLVVILLNFHSLAGILQRTPLVGRELSRRAEAHRFLLDDEDVRVIAQQRLNASALALQSMKIAEFRTNHPHQVAE